jgi:ABC-type glycerol-3-phosphate transport system substrate-binding protein
MTDRNRSAFAQGLSRSVSRRTLLGAMMTAGVAGVTACSGVSGTSGSPAQAGSGSSTSQFNFSTYGDFRFYQDGFARMQEVAPEFKDVKFVNQQATGADTLAAKLLSSHVAKAYASMPDVCELQWSDIPRLSAAGILTDLTDRFAPYKDKVSKAALDAVSVNGRIMACPWRPNTTLVWYRDDVWKEAGVDGESIKLWDDFLEAGRQIRAYKYADGKPRYIIGNAPNPSFREYLYTQQGGTLFDPSSHKLTAFADDPRFRDAFTLQVEMAKKDGIGVQIEENTPSWYKALDEGTLSCLVNASWTDQQLQQNAPKSAGKWRVVQLPAFKSGDTGQALQGAASVGSIEKPTSNHDLNWAFMQHSFYNADITPSLYSKWHLNPCFQDAAVKVDYYKESPYYGGQNVGKLDADTQKVAHSPVGSPDYAVLMNTINAELGAAIEGKKSVDDAIKSAYSTAQSKSIGG